MATQTRTTPEESDAKDKRSLGPKRRLRPLSPTALKAFAECPKRFHYQYVTKTEVADVPSPVLVMGNALHRALAFFYRLPEDQRDPKILDRALRHFWAREKGRQEVFASDDEEAGWGRRALEALDWYANTYELDLRPLAVEEWLQTELPTGAFVGGKVDRVDERPGIGGLEVIDYKSGRARLEDEDLPADPGAQIYALAASHTFAEPVTRVRFIYLTERIERRWEVESEDLEATAERVQAAVAEVQAERDFAARPDDHCRWCSYRQLCPDRDRTSLDQLDREVGTPF
jgi:putative RecB family exonuclease